MSASNTAWTHFTLKRKICLYQHRTHKGTPLTACCGDLNFRMNLLLKSHPWILRNVFSEKLPAGVHRKYPSCLFFLCDQLDGWSYLMHVQNAWADLRRRAGRNVLFKHKHENHRSKTHFRHLVTFKTSRKIRIFPRSTL